MKAFTYERASSPAQAAAVVARTPGAKFIAGGTNLLDLMKLEIETPTHLVDVNELGLDKIERTCTCRARQGEKFAYQTPYRRDDGGGGDRSGLFRQPAG
jgi:xanthine dehydrogenase YagS FAD-binding subunit